VVQAVGFRPRIYSIMQHAHICWIALVLFCGSVTQVGRANDKLRDALVAELNAMECPGALVGVLVGKEPPQVFCVGVADVKTKAPMQRDFHMRIASVTKPILGTAVLLLADEGKLSVDDPMSKYVSDVPGGETITLRQLANNTSGLFNSIENKEFQAAIVTDPKRPWPAKDILAAAFAKPSYHEPGKAWRYSNTNAVLLGEVIDKVAGTPHAKFINERVLKPLGLAQTGFVPDATVPPPAPSSYRNGYEHKWLGYGQTFYDVTEYSAAWSGAAGNMYSTVDDLLKAAKPIATGALLSEKSRGELHSWVKSTRAELEYGFCIGTSHGWQGHYGDVPGYSSFMGYFPAKDISLVTLTNLSNNKDGTSPAERMRDVVIKYLDLNTK
jgi:D-alanyl-D-alanine carboxypeptidase